MSDVDNGNITREDGGIAMLAVSTLRKIVDLGKGDVP
jgi:hypothetical protein